MPALVSARRRLLLLALAIVIGLPVAGALYQTLSVRSESGRFPPPGRLINVARPGEPERRLHLVCIGQGEHTVIFEPSGFGGALSATAAREEIAAHSRVCSYDRMGTGWSDPAPSLISMGMLADDLERLTVRAGLRPPFVLVPASIGGIPVELFARRHPDQVAGLVYADAANSAMLLHFAPQFSRMQVEAACLAKTAARLGILRLFDPFGLRKERSFAAEQAVALTYRVEPAATVCGVVRGLQTSIREIADAPPLPPDVPLLVLVHEKPDRLLPPGFDAETARIEREWLPLQQSFVQRSSRGVWRIVPGSGHLIADNQPHAVASAVLELLQALRATATP
jgi:pimeloyl-ACP methyl ester carboxylesterase